MQYPVHKDMSRSSLGSSMAAPAAAAPVSSAMQPSVGAPWQQAHHIMLLGGGMGQHVPSGQVLYPNQGSRTHNPSCNTLGALDSLTMDALATLLTPRQLATLLQQPGALAGMPLPSAPSPPPRASDSGLPGRMLGGEPAPLLPPPPPIMLNSLGSIPDEPSFSGISSFAEESGVATAESTSVYVKNLPPEETELSLYRKFAPMGAVLSCKVLEDAGTGRCRGVGFVNYGSAAEAAKAVQKLNGARIGPGRVMQVVLQAPRAARIAAAAATAAAVAQSSTRNSPDAAVLGPTCNSAAQFPGSGMGPDSGSSGNSLQQQQSLMVEPPYADHRAIMAPSVPDALKYLAYANSGTAAALGSAPWSPHKPTNFNMPGAVGSPRTVMAANEAPIQILPISCLADSSGSSTLLM